MADKLTIWNWALHALGEARMATLTDQVKAYYVFTDLWDGVVLEAFSQGDWNRFKSTVSLTESATGTVIPSRSYIYDYPSDYVRTVAVSPDAFFNSPFTDYNDEGGFLHANVEPLYLKYISNALVDTPDSWPNAFARYVAALLAFESCEAIKNSTSDKQELEKDMESARRTARSIDAKNEQGKAFNTGSWARSRRGYGLGTNTSVVGGSAITFEEGDV